MGTSGGRRTAATLATVAVVVVGCGGDVAPPAEDGPPVVVAEPVPFDDTLSPEPSPDATPEPPDDPSPAPEEGSEAEESAAEATDDAAEAPATGPTSTGPTSADAAAFVGGGTFASLSGVQHAVADLDGDTWAEVVVTGVRGRRGVLEVAWWTGTTYEVLATGEGGRGRDVTDLHAADVNRDGLVEVLITVEGDGLQSLSVWQVSGPGALDRLQAVGGCHDGSHVYGVTTARLQDAGDAPPVIVADCDESPLPVADWSEERWVWQDGAYRHAATPGGDGDGDDGQPGNGNGRDDGEAGDD